jgi:flagellar motor switch protein FliM
VSPQAGLNPAEVNALLSAIQEGQVPSAKADAPKVAPYDLTSQDRIIRGQMPTLDAIHEQIAATFGIGLAGRTRLSIRVAASPATMMKFVDLAAMLVPPAVVCVLSLGPGLGHALVIFEPGLAEALLAAALGDRKAQGETGRGEMTAVEQLVLRRLLGILTDGMQRAWQEVTPFKPEVLRFESDPRMASIAPASEVAIVSGFEISGGMSGRLQLVLPYAAIEPVRARLISPPRVSGASAGRFTESLAREVAQVEVQVRGVLGRVLLLDAEEGAPLPIYVQGVPKLLGTPKVSGGSMALVVEGAVGATPQRKKDL